MIALRVARAVLGWPLGEAAEIAGLGHGHLSKLEAGRSKPSKDTLERLRIAYGEALETAERHYGAVATMERGRPRLSA